MSFSVLLLFILAAMEQTKLVSSSLEVGKTIQLNTLRCTPFQNGKQARQIGWDRYGIRHHLHGKNHVNMNLGLGQG